jgi:RNA polymerase sigma factor (sigma-70 family)
MHSEPAAASDGQLMARFYGCEAAAFEQLQHRWWRRLFRFFRKKGFSADDAEDGSMETLVRLCVTKDAMSFDVRQPLAPFLFRIAANLAIQEYRRRGRTPPIVPLEEVDAACGLPEPLSLSAEEILAAIRELDHQEQAYLLHCSRHGIGDLSHGEIARLLGVSPARVSQISHRALGHLRERLAQHGAGREE